MKRIVPHARGETPGLLWVELIGSSDLSETTRCAAHTQVLPKFALPLTLFVTKPVPNGTKYHPQIKPKSSKNRAKIVEHL